MGARGLGRSGPEAASSPAPSSSAQRIRSPFSAWDDEALELDDAPPLRLPVESALRFVVPFVVPLTRVWIGDGAGEPSSSLFIIGR